MTKETFVTLLGDSTIDNRNYVPKDHTVMDYVWEALDKKAHVRQPAQDGAVIKSIYNQVRIVKPETSHLVVSIGGNDLLGVRHSVYSSETKSVRGALLGLAYVRGVFAKEYERMAQEVHDFCGRHDIELALATVYRGNAFNDDDQAVNQTAVCIFNQVIRETAAELNVGLIDLYTLFDDPDDFANPIEPSAQGGWKWGQAVKAFVEYEFPPDETSAERPTFAGPVVIPENMTFPRIQFAQAIGDYKMWDPATQGDNWGTYGGVAPEDRDRTDPSVTELLLTDEVKGDPLYEDVLEDLTSDDPEEVRRFLLTHQGSRDAGHEDDSWRKGEGLN